MPLIIPGITSNDPASKTEEWTNKLVGKKLGDEPSTETTFCKADLPKETRVIQPGQMVTRDFKPDRITPGSKSKVKSSVQRAIRTQITTTYPLLTPYIDEVIPKKEQLDAMKMSTRALADGHLQRPDRVTLYLIGSTPLFYQHMSDALLPHLKLVHRFPTCFPSIRIDRGAIRFVLSGATLMAPGLTSTGGRLPSGDASGEGIYGEVDPGRGKEGKGGRGEGWYGGRELEKGEPVVICAEGKEEACAVGLLSMGTKEVKEKGKGPVVEDGHYLGDGLWRLNTD